MANFLTYEVSGQQQLEAKLKALAEAFDTRHILDEGAAVLFNHTRTRFLKETDPTGQKWIPSFAALRRKKSGRGGGTLFATGRMFRGLQLFAPSETTRAIGVNVTSPSGYFYPAAHQFGLYGMEQRMFLGFGTQDVRLMGQVILNRAIKALGS